MVKSKFIASFSGRSVPGMMSLLYCIVAFSLFTLVFKPTYGQPVQLDESMILQNNADLYKNRVEYDSAAYYYQLQADYARKSGDLKNEIFASLYLLDVYILQRSNQRAYILLNDISEVIENKFSNDNELFAELFQVKGSYSLSFGNIDSARLYFMQSIMMRGSVSPPADSSFHYVYNKLGNLFLNSSNFDSAYYYHKKALEVSLNKKHRENFLTASSYQNLGIAAQMKGDYNQAETCYLTSLKLKKQLFADYESGLAKIYGNLGKLYTDLSDYNRALEYYYKSEVALASKYSRENIQFAHLYWNQGNVYTHLGNYSKATDYLTKAYSIFESSLGRESQEFSKVCSDLAFTYDKKGDTLQAIEFYQQAAQNKFNSGIVKIFRNLGNIYQNKNQNDSADKYFHLSIERAKEFFRGNSYDLALCYQYYGEFLFKTDEDQLSLNFYIQASGILTQLFGRKSKDLAKVLFLQSQYYLKKEDYDPALKIIQNALITLLPAFEEKDIHVNPEIDIMIPDLYLPTFLYFKARALDKRYDKSKDSSDLLISLQTINLTLEIIEEIRRTYNDEESQLILNKDARTVINIGVIVAQKLHELTGNAAYLSQAFHFSEKGKSIILLSALRGLKAQESGNIPKETLEYEEYLSRELATYNNLLYQEKQKKIPDEVKIQLFSNRVFGIRHLHDSLLTSYKELFPEYFKLKYDYTITPPDSVRAWLGSDQAILEYHLTDSLLFGFLITNDSVKCALFENKNELVNLLDSLRDLFIRKEYFNTGQQELKELIEKSTALYKILVKPFEKNLTGKRLIIIPDGELGYLSFDLLLKDSLVNYISSYKELPWLIKYNPISYSSSATVFFEQSKQRSGKLSANILAFAPSYDYQANFRNGNTIDSVMMGLTPITGTQEEIYSISEFFRTKKRFDNKASEDYFKKHAGEYGILHLAMHAIIDDRNPLNSKLVFSPPDKNSTEDGYLNTYELFNLQLPGYLAVLSACNTGSGKLERGEGIISLARGFFYAGIPSVIMTLWEIEDHSSANLMALFYQNLKNGLPNDIALQQAKLKYLETAGKLQSHPYFWAGYVSIGKVNPIESSSSGPTNILIFTISLILIISIVIIFFTINRVFFRKKRINI